MMMLDKIKLKIENYEITGLELSITFTIAWVLSYIIRR